MLVPAEYGLLEIAGRAIAGQAARLCATAEWRTVLVDQATWHDVRTSSQHPANPGLYLKECGSRLLRNGHEGWAANCGARLELVHVDSKEQR